MAEISGIKRRGGVKKDKGQVKKTETDERLREVHSLGLKTGHVQAFGAIRLLSEYLEWKAIQAIVDDAETLENMGYSTIDEYFEAHKIKRSTGFKNLKIARNLSAEEVQMCGQIGLTRADLFTYAYIPDDQRLQIKDGKIEGLETADLDEAKHFIKTMVKEYQQTKEIATKIAIENEALQKTTKELNARLPNQANLAWAYLAVNRISDDIADIQSNMNLLLDSMDHRLVGNSEFNARISGLYDTANRMLIEVFYKVEKLTGYHPDRNEAAGA
jgi:hypothetical protein